MTGKPTVEERLTALEIDVARLKQLLPASRPTWFEQVSGSFKNEPAFEEVVNYGRAIRQADGSDVQSRP